MIISFYSIILLFYLALLTTNQTLCTIGCLACTKLQRICTACDNEYQLTSTGTCIKINATQNCSIFTLNNTCIKCKPTYRLVNSSCAKDYSGCLQYEGNRCVSCGFGTTLSNDCCVGTLNCQQYNKTCSSCKAGYIYSAGKCFYIKRDCVKVDVSSGACSVCAANLTLVGFTCQKLQSTIAYCDLWEKDKCLMCKQGWGLFQNKCVLIPQCQANQFVNDRFQCQQLSVGCMKGDSNGCSKCNPNFILSNNSCLQNLPNNCLEITTKGVCKTCKERYYSYQFQCSKVSIFCGKYDSYGRCLNCRYPYYQSIEGKCKDPNCISSTVEGCINCRTNFIVQNNTGRCIINDPLCINSTDLICNQCVSGYYASTDICLPLPSNCLKANREGACTECTRNFYLQQDQCYQINKNISNCRTYYQYSDTPKCIECELGYFISLGKCLLLPPHCSIVLSNGNCVTCNNKLAVSNNLCSLQIGLNCALLQGEKCVRCQVGFVLAINNFCYSFSDQCVKRDPSGLCTQCKDGFIPSRMTCLAATLIDINCKIYNNTACVECYPGYYQANNLCNTPNANCQQYDRNNGGCLSCFPGYLLTNLQCIVTPKVQNCLNYSVKGICTRCQSFFYLNNNKCAKVNQLCSAYNAMTGACTRCFPGFTLKDPGCVLQVLANVFNPYTNATEITDICEQYNFTNGYCVGCKEGFYLSQKKCINYGNLPNADLNCKTFRSQKECQLCYQGYTLQGGVCRATNVLCRQFGVDGSCLICFDGYTLRNGVCVLLSSQQYDACLVITGSSCKQCRIGFKLNQGNCQAINTQQTTNNPYCQYASLPNYCDLCTIGFYAQSGQCYQVSPYCDNYNPSNGQCLTCKDLYVLSEGSCVFPAMGVDQSCIKYQGVYCKTCKAGFYLKDYICKQIDSNCVDFNFDVNQCLQCSMGTPLFDNCV